MFIQNTHECHDHDEEDDDTREILDEQFDQHFIRVFADAG
jgi:hypothetical protein